MGRYFKKIILFIIPVLFFIISYDVSAVEFSDVPLTNSHGFLLYKYISTEVKQYQNFPTIGTTYYFQGSNNQFAMYFLYWSGSANWVQNGYYHSVLEYEIGGIPVSDWFDTMKIEDNMALGSNVSCRYTKSDVIVNGVPANGVHSIKQDCYFYYNGNSGTSVKDIGFGFSPVVQLSTDTFFRLASFSLQYGGLFESDQQVIIDQNNTIINNTDDIIENQDEIKQNQEEIKESLTDDTPPDTSGLENAAGWLPAGPVDSLVTLPITLLQSLTNNLDSACTPINLPIPYINDNLTLDCPATLLKRFDGFWLFWEGFGLIAGCWCLYKYFINLYKWVESHLSMDEKESLGKWGGV